MEFLDDLLNPPESEEESDAQPAGGSSERTADIAGQSPPQPLVTPDQNDEAWANLLEDVALDDSAAAVENAEAQKGRRDRAQSRGLSTSQKVILGILGLVVMGIWAVIILLLSRSFSSRSSGATRSLDSAKVTVVSYTDVTPVSSEPSQDDADANTEDETALESAPTATPKPQIPPTATPPVFTAFDRQIQAAPDDIELYLQRAEVYITLGVYEATLADLETAKGFDPTRAEIYVSEGWANFNMGHWQRAEEAFGSAVSFNQDLHRAHFGLGQLYFYLGRYKEAASEFDWAAEIDPGNVEAEAWLAIASAKLQDKEEADGAVSRAISQTNTMPIVYIAQSWARRVETPPDIDGAQADLLYAQGLEHNDFMTLNALSEFYISHRPERLAEAEQLASYAYNWATTDLERAVARQTLGRVYLQQERKVDAERVFIEAVNLTSRDGDILLFELAEDLAKAKER